MEWRCLWKRRASDIRDPTTALGEYMASQDDILHNRLKVDVKVNLVVDADSKGQNHNGKATMEEKKAVMRRLEGYDLTH